MEHDPQMDEKLRCSYGGDMIHIDPEDAHVDTWPAESSS